MPETDYGLPGFAGSGATTSALIGPAESLRRSAACRSALRLARLHDLIETLPLSLPPATAPSERPVMLALFSSTCAIEGRPADARGVRFCRGRLCPDRPRTRPPPRDDRDLDRGARCAAGRRLPPRDRPRRPARCRGRRRPRDARNRSRRSRRHRGLPGLPGALSATLAKAWSAGIDLASRAQATGDERLASLARVEAAALDRLPPGMCRPADLVARAIERLCHAPRVLGEVEFRAVAEVDPCWRTLVMAVARTVPARWAAGPRAVPDWVRATGIDGRGHRCRAARGVGRELRQRASRGDGGFPLGPLPSRQRRRGERHRHRGLRRRATTTTSSCRSRPRRTSTCISRTDGAP